MKRPLRLLVAAAVLAVGLSTVAATPAPAATGPLRSGRIVNGMWSPGAVSFIQYWITGRTVLEALAPSPRCDVALDCAAWLASGCSASLAGRDPAWSSSIVNVSGLADGSTPRTFSETSSFHWGTLTIELWDRECQPISGGWICASWAVSCDGRTVRLPKGAAWMTIVSTGDNANTTWTLR